MRLYLRQHSDDGNRLVSEHVVPLIELMPKGPARASTIVALSPALYRNHKTTALHLFNTIEDNQRDTALITCAKFILERHIPSDPYEGHENGYEITYQEAVDVLELANEVARDNLVYSLIVALADTISSPWLSKKYTRRQITDLILRIEQLAQSKFPDQCNIQHDGYTIASKAQILRIERGTTRSWRTVIQSAGSIPNKADRAYVLAIIGKALPARETVLREEVFNEATSITETIPCTYDRLERLDVLAEMMALKCPHLAKRCLSEAISGFRSSSDEVDAHVFRNMVDTAFKFDPEFAASLVVARLLRFPGYSQTRQKAKDRFAWAGFRFQEQREGHDRRTRPRCTRY